MSSQLADEHVSTAVLELPADPPAPDEAALRHVVCAVRAMQRSVDPDYVLDVLASSVRLVVPEAAVWAVRAPEGEPLAVASAFDPTSEFGGACAEVTVASNDLLEALSARIGVGRAPAVLAAEEIPAGLEAAGRPLSVTAFPLGSPGVRGLLLLAVPFERLSSRERSLVTLLCDSATGTLDLDGARSAAQHTEALFETLTRLTASSSDPELVLQQIVRSTADLLGTDAAWVMLVDEERQLLTVRTAFGITGRSFFDATCGIDELLPGVAIRKRRVVSIRDLHGDQRARHSKREGLRSMVCAPLFAGDEVLGVLVAAHREIADPSAEDRRIMGALANAAAVSIANARLYAERESSIRQLGQVNRLLEERSEALERTMGFQKRLSELVLAGSGLSELVCTMTDALGRPVLVLDRDLLVLHASEDSDPEIDLPALREAAASLDDEAETLGVARLTVPRGGDDSCVLVAPLTLAGDRTAFVVVLEGDEPLDETRLGMAEAAVTAIGLELMRDRASAEAEARLTGGLFQTILSGSDIDEATIARRASYLGYELSGANVVIAVAVGEERGNGSRPSQLGVQGAVQRALRRHRDNTVAVFERDDVVFVLLSDPEAVTPARIREECRLVKHALEFAGRAAGARIGISAPHTGIEGIRAAVTEAVYTLHVQHVLGTSGAPAAFDELGVWTLLGRIGSREHLVDFAQGVLGPLLAHDAERQSQLVETLRTLIRCNFHYRTAAEALYAHPNTIRYRMSRIGDLAGLDLGNGDDRLKVEIALRILDVVGPPPATA